MRRGPGGAQPAFHTMTHVLVTVAVPLLLPLLLTSVGVAAQAATTSGAAHASPDQDRVLYSLSVSFGSVQGATLHVHVRHMVEVARDGTVVIDTARAVDEFCARLSCDAYRAALVAHVESSLAPGVVGVHSSRRPYVATVEPRGPVGDVATIDASAVQPHATVDDTSPAQVATTLEVPPHVIGLAGTQLHFRDSHAARAVATLDLSAAVDDYCRERARAAGATVCTDASRRQLLEWLDGVLNPPRSRDVALVAEGAGLTVAQLQATAAADEAQTAVPMPALPPVQAAPSPGFPFVFHHACKCGGQTWQRVFNDSARALVGDALVYEGNLPVPYDRNLPDDPGVAAFIGYHNHFDGRQMLWRSATRRRDDVAALVAAGADDEGEAYDRGVAFVNVRDPVTRLVSCFNYMKPHLFDRDLHSFPPVELRRLLLRMRDVSGYGCLNELLRRFSGHAHERVINSIGYFREGDGALRPLDAELVKQAKLNLGTATVVGVLEDVPATRELVRHFLPWARLPQRLARVNDGRVGHGDTAATIAALSRAQLEVLVDLTRAERVVYNHALRLHRAQLAEARKRVP